MTAGEGNGGPGAGQRPVFVRTLVETVPAVVDALIAGASPRLHREALSLVERPLIAHVLALTGGNQLRAARLLGLNRNTLRKRCRDLDLALPRAPGRAAAR